jgi:hypothetical protein
MYTTISDRVRLEFEKESQTIEEYDVKISELEHEISITPDEVTKRKLRAERNKLISKREKLAKYINERFEYWQHFVRNAVPFGYL